MGCVGPWVPALLQQGGTGSGNPIKSQQIIDFRKSYRPKAIAAEVREISAVPLQLHEKETTLRHMLGALGTETRLLHRAGLARDGAMRCLL